MELINETFDALSESFRKSTKDQEEIGLLGDLNASICRNSNICDQRLRALVMTYACRNVVDTVGYAYESFSSPPDLSAIDAFFLTDTAINALTFSTPRKLRPRWTRPGTALAHPVGARLSDHDLIEIT
eukprot:gene8120-5382_t